eukprot:PITA_32083
MIIQIDLAKSYDKLSWSYIRAILRAYGFDHNWIRWVMALVSTTSFYILLNGSPSRTLLPSRGLRQGYLLSPFLFVLMMEGLGRTIKSASAEGRLQGLKLTIDGAASTHQQFVDDTMLQGIPMDKEAKYFKQILNDFAMVTGTEVSIEKSEVFLFNTDIAIQRNLTRIIGFQRDQLPSKYLGISLTDKPLCRGVWKPAIPILMMSTLPTPKGVIQQIRNIQRDFLWGKGEEKNKWTLVSWDKICKRKAHGGLGLHDPETLNRVPGVKLWLRWLKESSTPWAKLWK